MSTVNMENYEEYMMLEADGELNEVERKALYDFVAQHPELQKELDAYLSVRLTPDTNLVYENKEQLMKKGGGTTISLRSWGVYAAAACLAGFIAVSVLKKGNDINNDAPSVAQVTNTAKQPTTNIPTNDTTEELHSQTTNPIAYENKREPVKQHKTKTVQQQYTLPQNPVQQEIQVAQDNEHIIREPKLEIPAPVAKTNNTLEAKVHENENPIVNAAEPEQKMPSDDDSGEQNGAGFFSWLKRKATKSEGGSALAEAVNNKIEKAKNIGDNLKNTDVVLKIGNKELFVVKL